MQDEYEHLIKLHKKDLIFVLTTYRQKLIDKITEASEPPKDIQSKWHEINNVRKMINELTNIAENDSVAPDFQL